MIDETCGMEEKVERSGARTRVMESLNLNGLGWLKNSPVQRVRDLGLILRYCLSGGYSTKRRIPVEVEKLVDMWISAIVGMCLSHDKDSYDAHDAKADTLLTPLLAAPIAQVREFYFKLLEKMKSDSRVPFLVWISFDAWGEAIVKNAPDEGIKRLKHKLAKDIADLVEKPIADQIPEAIKRALCWRDPETLQDMKDVLQSGAKPKLVGRQSCLFLEAHKGKKKISVMV